MSYFRNFCISKRLEDGSEDEPIHKATTTATSRMPLLLVFPGQPLEIELDATLENTPLSVKDGVLQNLALAKAGEHNHISEVLLSQRIYTKKELRTIIITNELEGMEGVLVVTSSTA